MAMTHTFLKTPLVFGALMAVSLGVIGWWLILDQTGERT
jgi:hypothetical protein